MKWRILLKLLMALPALGLVSCALSIGGQKISYSEARNAVNTQLAKAYELALAGDDLSAEKALLRAQEIESKNPWVALNLGAIYQRSGHSEKALKQYQFVMELNSAEVAELISAGARVGATPSDIARANVAKMELWKTSRVRVPLIAGPAKVQEPAVVSSVATEVVTQAKSDLSHPQKLEQFLESWRSSWERLDYEAYIAHYKDDFYGSKKNRAKWLQDRNKAFKRNSKSLRIRLVNPEIKISEFDAEVSFIQNFSSSSFRDEGLKILRLVNNAGEWKIYKESFSNKNW